MSVERKEAVRQVDGEDLDYSEWIAPVPRGYAFTCCDCGLTHRMDLKVGADGLPEFRVARDDEATELERAGEEWEPKPGPPDAEPKTAALAYVEGVGPAIVDEQ